MIAAVLSARSVRDVGVDRPAREKMDTGISLFSKKEGRMASPEFIAQLLRPLEESLEPTEVLPTALGVLVVLVLMGQDDNLLDAILV